MLTKSRVNDAEPIHVKLCINKDSSREQAPTTLSSVTTSNLSVPFRNNVSPIRTSDRIDILDSTRAESKADKTRPKCATLWRESTGPMLAKSNTKKVRPRHPIPTSKTEESSQPKFLGDIGEPDCAAHKAESEGAGQEKLCKNADSTMCAPSTMKAGKSMRSMPDTGRKLSEQLDCLIGAVDAT